MAVNGVTEDAVRRIGSSTDVAAVRDYGTGFDVGAGGQAGSGAEDTSSVQIGWQGMTLDDFTQAAVEAGMDPVADADTIEAAFNAVADANGTMSFESFNNAFEGARVGEDGWSVEVDNAAFVDRIGELAQTGAQTGAGSTAAAPDDVRSCGTEAAQGAAPPEATNPGEALIRDADTNLDGVLSPDEVKDLVRAAFDAQGTMPEAEVEAIAQQLLQEIGGPNGIDVPQLNGALEAVGADLSTQEGLRTALADIAAGEASPQSENEQGEADRRNEDRMAAAAQT